jgi:hypothetical protein
MASKAESLELSSSGISRPTVDLRVVMKAVADWFRRGQLGGAVQAHRWQVLKHLAGGFLVAENGPQPQGRSPVAPSIHLIGKPAVEFDGERVAAKGRKVWAPSGGTSRSYAASSVAPPS